MILRKSLTIFEKIQQLVRREANNLSGTLTIEYHSSDTLPELRAGGRYAKTHLPLWHSRNVRW